MTVDLHHAEPSGTDGGGPATVCLFAQYHPHGRIPPHTRAYLVALARCGLRLSVACAGGMGPGDHEFLRSIGATGIARANRGLDFGAWAELLAAGHADGAPRVVLANDSVFGPFGDLRQVIATMDRRGFDAWGMVESRERMPHLQSWFVSLSARALAAPAVRRVLAQDFASMGKDAIILHGELGLSVALREAGLTTGAAWPAAAGLRRLIPVNPSHFDWRAMLIGGAVPFIKVELLRDNPAAINWLHGWRQAVLSCDGDPASIDAALGDGSAWQPPQGPTRLARRLLNVALTRDRGAALLSLLRP